MPDPVLTQRIQPPFIAFDHGQSKGKLLRPISKEEHERLLQTENVIRKEIKAPNIEIPTHEIGQPPEPKDRAV